MTSKHDPTWADRANELLDFLVANLPGDEPEYPPLVIPPHRLDEIGLAKALAIIDAAGNLYRDLSDEAFLGPVPRDLLQKIIRSVDKTNMVAISLGADRGTMDDTGKAVLVLTGYAMGYAAANGSLPSTIIEAHNAEETDE